MLMRLFLTRTREEFMIRWERKGSGNKSRLKIMEEQVGLILIRTICTSSFSIKSHKEASLNSILILVVVVQIICSKSYSKVLVLAVEANQTNNSNNRTEINNNKRYFLPVH
jgi:hypothetical protein